MENSKLTKTNNDRIISGVCGGLAKFFGMDSSVFRFIFALCTVFGIGSPIIIYLILAVIMPNDNYSFE